MVEGVAASALAEAAAALTQAAEDERRRVAEAVAASALAEAAAALAQAAEDERRRASVKAPSAKRTRGPCKRSGEGKGKEKKKEENSGTVTMRSGHWTEEENIQFELGEAR